MDWNNNFDWNFNMIAEIIVWGFFSAIGWWGAQKLIIEKIESPKDPPVCIEQKETVCGVKGK
jgi:hypothetical protein